MTAPHTQRVGEVLADRQAATGGLTAGEAATRLHRYGPNELRETISRPAWKMLLAQFVEPLILILLAAAGLSFFLGDLTEGIAILAIVILFGMLGFIQEYRAEKAIAALKQLTSPIVRVRRDGALHELPARDLVPGDIVFVEAGNIVPADLRLIDCANLGVMEAALTGESEAVRKQTEALAGEQLPLGDRTNLAYLGTAVVHGRGSGVVTGTGMHTELGKIAGMIQGIEAGRTPLQRKMAEVGKHLSIAGLIAAAGLLAMGLLRGEPFTLVLLTAVSLLVAVVPEGLPAVITATLAFGARRMLHRRALIRKLPAVETLGAVTVICTDKTGTLTENRMTVTRLHTLHHDLSLADTLPLPPEADSETAPLLLAAALCNDGHLIFDRDHPGGPPRSIGDPTETALLVAAERFGIRTESLAAVLPRLAEFAFDSGRKRMTTLHRGDASDGALPAAFSAPVFAASKGSPDGLLALATHAIDNGRVVPLTDGARRRFLAGNEQMANDGLRVLGVAMRRFDAAPSPHATAGDVEGEFVFCGLAGMMDPPRDAARSAVAKSHAAGIRTAMITGDHPATAAAIARNLHLAPEGREPDVLTGVELAALSDAQLLDRVERITVYARVSPEDKLRIVTALQQRGHIVAMTGDGVNDSPALRRAEIGVAMGISGTDVAKEASEMVLLDDNFATIVAAVEEGRTIYDNLVRFIKFSFGGNLGKVLVMLLAPLAGIGGIALRPLHLLWLNLLTDGLMGLGLGLERPERDVMTRPPRRPDASVLDRATLLHVGWMGVFICLAALLLAGAWHRFSPREGQWQTILFAAIGFAQIGQAWGLRALSERPFRFGRNLALVGLTCLTLLLQLGVIYIPALARAFTLQPLPPLGLAATAGLGVLTFGVVHSERWMRVMRFNRRQAPPHAVQSKPTK
ncbi:MAG: cation-translocating P-type ATPase [Thermoguttaceae bacterium]|nr:cation-translocating P-type ATPase [Thermoguttaceae bacterium]